MTLCIAAQDGALLEIECDGDAISGLQRQAGQIVHAIPASARSNGLEPGPTGNDNVTGAPIGREPTVVAAVGSDASERIKAQRENVGSIRMFADLLENSDAAIIDHDFSALFRVVQELKQSGVHDLRRYISESDDRLQKLIDVVRINNANGAALRMLGVSSLVELGKQTTNIIDIAEAIFRGDTRIRRSEYLVAGGTPIPVVYSLRVPMTEEEARRVPIVIMDLSDVRLAEAARQATVAKSQFLSSMSHEIRTPLNGMIGNLELLALTGLDNEQFELIDDADKAAKSLLALVGNILDFSKIEAGKLTTEIGDINPAALVEEAVDVLQSVGRQKRIFVAATIGPNVPSLVRGDAMRIRQILLNLIGNAVKCTDQGGVQVSLTATAWDQAICELRFEVNDSGRGFSQGLAAGLFEPFTQDRTAVVGAATEGTGLGLSICKSLVAAFGGAIGCDGEIGKGATFWFTLPMAVVMRAPKVRRPDLTGIRVMVIGEVGEITGSLREYFETRGATVVIEGPQGALAFARAQGTDTDPTIDVAVIIPDGNGALASETARLLREQHIVPLLYGTDQTPRTWLREGFAAVIPPDPTATHLDRNFRLLVGHAQARDRVAAHQSAVASAFRPTLRGKRVLVLEDRLVNQTVIQKQLRKLGIECTLAVNGIKGLETLDRQRFDLILCDCSMPRMNGYDFTRELRKREASERDGRHAPVIALTANAFGEDADKCFEAGMDDFISKPITMDRLAAILVRWLSPLVATPIADVQRPPVEADAAPMIDMAALAEILGTNDPKMLDQVLADYLAVAGASLSDVEAAVSGGDPGSIKAAAHGAKGEARCAAATRLADLYAELDRRAKDGDRTVSEGLVVRAAAEVRRVEDFIRGRLGASASQ